MVEQTLAKLRIVLVEPAGPLNVGAIARVMKNLGLQHLVLVQPHCDPLGPEARQMAVHAQDLLEAAQQVATLPEALQGCQRVMATTARDRSLELAPESPRTGLSWLLGPPAALIFGPEDRGLSNSELNYAQRYLRIPTHPDYPSLNLAQAVAICSYELSQLVQAQGGAAAGEEEQVPGAGDRQSPFVPPEIEAGAAAFEALEAYYQQLEAVLLKIGYLYPHTASSRMAKFRRLFNRAQLSEVEVTMLRGILSQVEWALQARES